MQPFRDYRLTRVLAALIEVGAAGYVVFHFYDTLLHVVANDLPFFLIVAAVIAVTCFTLRHYGATTANGLAFFMFLIALAASKAERFFHWCEQILDHNPRTESGKQITIIRPDEKIAPLQRPRSSLNIQPAASTFVGLVLAAFSITLSGSAAWWMISTPSPRLLVEHDRYSVPPFVPFEKRFIDPSDCSGCGGPAENPPADEVRVSLDEIREFYFRHPEFFALK
jgi:hypothetical protein